MDTRRLSWIMLAFGAGLLVTMFAAKTCDKQKGEPTSKPGGAAQSKPTTGPAASRPATRPAGATISEPKADKKTQWDDVLGKPNDTSLAIGSTDPGSGYLFQVRFNSNGAAIDTVKLSRHYATVDDKRYVDEFGYKKYVEALAKGDDKSLKGPCSLMNPVSYDGITYYPLATRKTDVTYPGTAKAPYRHDPQMRRGKKKWRAWKPLPQAEAKALSLASTGDEHRQSFVWVLNRKDPGQDTFSPAVRVIKTYGVRKKDYTIYVSLRVENLWAGKELVKVAIDQAGPTGVPREDSRTDMRKVVYGKYDGEKVVGFPEKREDDVDDLNLGSPVNVGKSSDDESVLWIGQTNKFFGCMLHLRPEKGDGVRAPTWMAEYYHQDIKEPDAKEKDKASGTQMTGLKFPEITVEHGKPRTVEFELFAGPKRIDMFEDEDDEFHKPLYKALAYKDTLDLSDCFCASDWLSLFVVGFLGTLATHVTFGNYGLAIFVLVIVVRLLLHPLTKKGQVMMARMKKFQPMIKELEKKYADDKEALNRERIKLFREQGANPLLGCLPMLLQMPILIALWRGISATTDLRHAAFLPVWIVDLAAPDKLFPFGVDLPLIGGYLNLMPLLLGAAMYWQMKLSPQSPGASSPDQEKQQKMMQMMFPIMMPVMFYHMASGLTLYFLASTFFGAAESHYIRKHIEAREALEAAITTTVHMPGKRSRSSRPKKPKGPNWFKQN